MAMHNHTIKQQLEDIIRDTKILCELEPFVKKWSLDEIGSLFQENTASATGPGAELVTKIVDGHRSKCNAITEENDQGNMFRALKEAMMLPKGNNGHSQTIPVYHSLQPPPPSLPPHEATIEESLEDYDHELGTVLNALERIELVPAVTQIDIEDFVHGLGGKPDGPELHKTTTTQEWKNIFLEQWLHLNRLAEQTSSSKRGSIGFLKRHEHLRTTPESCLKSNRVQSPGNADLIACPSSRVNLDSHFVTSKKGNKNMSVSSSSSGQVVRKGGGCAHSLSSSPPYIKTKKTFLPEENSFTAAAAALPPPQRHANFATNPENYGKVAELLNKKVPRGYLSKKPHDSGIVQGGVVVRPATEEKSHFEGRRKGKLEKLHNPSVRPSSAVPLLVKSAGVSKFTTTARDARNR